MTPFSVNKPKVIVTPSGKTDKSDKLILTGFTCMLLKPRFFGKLIIRRRNDHFIKPLRPPVRARCPFVPRPAVVPRPEPCPRPTRLNVVREPLDGFKFPKCNSDINLFT